MNKKKIWIIVVAIVIIIILSFQTSKTNDTVQVSESEVIYNEALEITYTSNVFSKFGHFLSNLVGKMVEYVFIIINKIVSFIFGI